MFRSVLFLFSKACYQSPTMPLCSSSSTSSASGMGWQSYGCTLTKLFSGWMMSRNLSGMPFALSKWIHALHFGPKSSNARLSVGNVVRLMLVLSMSIWIPLAQLQHANQKLSTFVLTSSTHSVTTQHPSGCSEQQILTRPNKYMFIVSVYIK
jgi:hypothetical protein